MVNHLGFSSKLKKTLMLNITGCIYIFVIYSHKINICVIHLWLNPRLRNSDKIDMRTMLHGIFCS